MTDGDGGNLVKLTGSQIAAPEVLNEIETEAHGVLDRVNEIRDQVQESYFELGRLLYRVNLKAMYRHRRNQRTGAPYKDMEEYVNEEVGFAYRKAQHLMAIWCWFSELPNFAAVKGHLKEIGWAKTGALVGVADKKTVDDWIKLAREMSSRSLIEHTKIALRKAGRPRRPSLSQMQMPEGVSGLPTTLPKEPERDGLYPPRTDPEPLLLVDTGDDLSGTSIHGLTDAQVRPLLPGPGETRAGALPPTDEDVERHRFTLAADLTHEQKIHIDKAIQCAKQAAEFQETGQGVLLDFVCTHFLAFYSGAASDNEEWRNQSFANELFRAIERNFGVDLIAFRKNTAHVAYGHETLNKIEQMEEEKDAH